MTNEEQLIQRLENHRAKAPDGFTERVMDSLPAWRKKHRVGFWPSHGRWIVPALAGAARPIRSVAAASPTNVCFGKVIFSSVSVW